MKFYMFFIIFCLTFGARYAVRNSLTYFTPSLSAPSDVRVSDFSIVSGLVKAVVRWNASKELPCSYEIFWFPSLSDSPVVSQKVALPYNILSVTILDLPFNVNYTVRITPFAEVETGKSESAEAWFLTPTCLNLTGNSFNLCDTTSALGRTLLLIAICSVVLFGLAIFMLKLFRKKPKCVGYPSGVADVHPSMLPILVSADRIRLTAVLGRGAFGVVHRGVLMRGSRKSEEEVVAVKVLPSYSRMRQQLLHEVEMMHIVGRHEKIVGLMGFSLDLEKTFLILEYCPMGDLHSYLVRKKPELLRMKSLPAITPVEYSKMSIKKLHLGKRLCLYINQVAEGMEYIANLKLIHRDLAARNILMVDKDRIKIADFGLSRDAYETGYYLSSIDSRKKLPVKWMAPEAIEKQKFSSHSDVWSFGVFMWEVFRFGKEPYPGLSNVLEFLKNGYRLEWPNCRHEWYDLMLECWHDNPRRRPPFKELVKRITTIINTMYHYAVFF
ncbi:fibroblast growth factor receptor 1-A isoform X2 [Parasteatoda tepidariorum]|uniref:fibroblast growth factor receptor 1-A isoform X2 n=1 Tax=Parasteatoda tepidariorum TaxID=114398 RepID=UPI001C71862E|nr:fibroblast growth factor receptor 1-A isoform X2 [Parasteatoda tepidariorum]